MADGEVIGLVKEFRNMKGGLIPALQKIQEKYGYLSEENLKIAARELDVPLSQVYGAVTFYALFKLKPRGKYQIYVCRGTACHIKGGDDLLKEFERLLGVQSGETTKDRKFTLNVVNCMGSCSLAPVARVNDDIFGNLKPADVKKIIERYRREAKP